jgi:hypothetical protein
MTQAGSWDAACPRPATEQQCRDWSTANGRTMQAPHRVPGLPSACFVRTETSASGRSYFNTNPSGAINQGTRRVCFEGGCPPAAPPPAPPVMPPPTSWMQCARVIRRVRIGVSAKHTNSLGFYATPEACAVAASTNPNCNDTSSHDISLHYVLQSQTEWSWACECNTRGHKCCECNTRGHKWLRVETCEDWRAEGCYYSIFSCGYEAPSLPAPPTMPPSPPPLCKNWCQQHQSMADQVWLPLLRRLPELLPGTRCASGGTITTMATTAPAAAAATAATAPGCSDHMGAAALHQLG